jgi:hypothetical protein
MNDPVPERMEKMTKEIPRFFAALLVLIAGIAAAVGLPGQPSVGADTSAWQPSKEERRLDEIGWAKDIRDALSLATQHHRPIFFFSYSGTTDRPQAMATQRC